MLLSAQRGYSIGFILTMHFIKLFEQTEIYLITSTSTHYTYLLLLVGFAPIAKCIYKRLLQK